MAVAVPASCTHWNVRPPAPSGSVEAEPSRVMVAPDLTVWSGPALATGGWLTTYSIAMPSRATASLEVTWTAPVAVVGPLRPMVADPARSPWDPTPNQPDSMRPFSERIASKLKRAPDVSPKRFRSFHWT